MLRKEVIGIFVVLFFVVIGIAVIAQEEKTGCCCDENGTAMDYSPFHTQNECTDPFTILVPLSSENISKYTPDNISKICIDACGGAAPKPLPLPLAPKITFFKAEPLMGQKKFLLTWEINQTPNVIYIDRCKGNDCTNFGNIATFAGTSRSYVDDDASLEWLTNYTYRLRIVNTITSPPQESSMTASSSLGDIECWNRFDKTPFCISEYYYWNEPIQSYLKNFGYFGFSFTDNFARQVRTVFGVTNLDHIGKLDSRCHVVGINRLSQSSSRCKSNETCLVVDSNTICITPSPCDTSFNATSASCENTPSGTPSYCFSDKSQSVIERCYSCDKRMSCYDYRSKEACERDACGIGDCIWKPTYGAIGVGVCINPSQNNCLLCDKKTGDLLSGLDSKKWPSLLAYNELFDACSQLKAEALGKCLAVTDPSTGKTSPKTCEQATCSDYKTQQECNADTCGLGICKWFDSPTFRGCAKDADTPPQAPATDSDGDGIPDWWEIKYGLNPNNRDDAGSDSDGDGLSNLDEWLRGTLPNNPDSDGDGVSDLNDNCPGTPSNTFQVDSNGCPLPVSDTTDSDDDGIPDWWERKYGLNPNNPADAGSDSDGDGLSNLDEWLRGTLPNNPDSDGDGVSDLNDQHPGTPSNTQVDSNGRPPQGNGKPDCIDPNTGEIDPACEADKWSPETVIIPVGDRGAVKYLYIQITDQFKSTGEKLTIAHSGTGTKAEYFPKGYSTFLCVGSLCSPNVRVNATPLTVVNGFLTINGKPLGLQLKDGSNILRFYSQDPANNNEQVKQLEVNACTGCQGPALITPIDIEGARIVNGEYYTKLTQPQIKLSFDAKAELVLKRLVFGNSFTELSSSPQSGFSQNYTLLPPELAEAKYVLQINARGENGISSSNTPYSFNLTIDKTPPLLSFNVEQNSILENPDQSFVLSFNEPVFVTSIFFDEEHVAQNGRKYVFTRNLTSELKQVNSSKYNLTVNGIPDGHVALRVTAEDYAGNTMASVLNFIIDSTGPVISLAQPLFGISDKTPFDIVVETDQPAICRYSTIQNVDTASISYDAMAKFYIPEKQTAQHIIQGFDELTGKPENTPWRFYVVCKDGKQRQSNETFWLSVDSAPPKITAAYAEPNPIVEYTDSELLTTLKVSTERSSFCSYSTTTTSFSPENGFEGTGITPRQAHNAVVKITTSPTTYNIACISPTDYGKAAPRTATATIKITVDVAAPLTISCSYCPSFWNSTTKNIYLTTNKRAQCFWTLDKTTTSFGTVGYEHSTTLKVPSLGEKKVLFSCNAGAQSATLEYSFLVDNSPPVMLYVSDNSSLKEDTEHSYFTDRLRAAWLGQDNESGITRYYYSLIEKANNAVVINCSPGSQQNNCRFSTVLDGNFFDITQDHNGKSLNLTDGFSYFLKVWPLNRVGLLGNPMDSDGVVINKSKKPAHCSDGITNEGESGQDCGGECEPCPDGQPCRSDSDCLSKTCIEGSCKAPSCTDLRKNGNESSIDCGGSCPTKCEAGKSCNTDSDCKTGLSCISGACAEPTACENGILDGLETDIDCGRVCPTKCAAGKGCLDNKDCADGLYCVSGVCSSTTPTADSDGDGVTNDLDQCPNTPKGEKVDKNGCSASQRDTDGDGMNDAWEIRYGFDPENPADAYTDVDADGLSNLEEFKLGTDPRNPDTDGDGWSDGAEFKAGTDPLDPASKPSAPIVRALPWLLLVAILAIAGYAAYKYRKQIAAIFVRKKVIPLPKPPVVWRPPPRPVQRVVRVPTRAELIIEQLRKIARATKAEEEEYIPVEELARRAAALEPTEEVLKHLKAAVRKSPEFARAAAAQPKLRAMLKKKSK